MVSKVRFALLDMFTEIVPFRELYAPDDPAKDPGDKQYPIIGFAVLVQHPELGNVLFDTGIDGDWQKNWNEEMLKIYNVQYVNRLEDKLKEFDLTPEDIDLLILSHMHYDHAGNLRLFQNTKAGSRVLISEAEAREAFVAVNMDDTGYCGAYWKPEFLGLKGIRYELVKEGMKLADDMELFIQRGHTPGVLGLKITAESGTYIFPSDAGQFSWNFEDPMVMPGFCADPDGYRNNIRELQAMAAETGGKIVLSHDIEFLKLWKMSPYMYE